MTLTPSARNGFLDAFLMTGAPPARRHGGADVARREWTRGRTFSPSTTANTLVRTYTAIDISDDLLITKASLLAAGLVCRPWVVTALVEAPVTDPSAVLVVARASVEATPGGCVECERCMNGLGKSKLDD